jgi:outer membrane protein assembly factor BamB
VQVASGLVSAGAPASTGCAIGQERPASERARDASADGAIYIERQSTGSEIWQVTTEEFRQSNIYCELPYCSGDSRHFIYERYNSKLSGKNKTELMVVELGTWKQHRLDVASGITGSAISDDGVFYYLKRTDRRDAGPYASGFV